MNIRRVVTGVNEQGRATFAQDSAISPRMAAMLPGLEMLYVWGADEAPIVPAAGEEPGWREHFPPPEGFRVVCCVLPPARVAGRDEPLTEDEVAEAAATFPGLLETFDPAEAGFHTSDTVDIAVLLSGDVELELDDGAVRRLGARDVVIQNGTRHRWTNVGDTSAEILFVLLGAQTREARSLASAGQRVAG